MTDPEYDAQFQRGYNGPPIPGPEVPPVPRLEPRPERDADAAAAPVAPLDPVDEIRDSSVVGEVPDVDAAEPTAPRRNPWSIALLIVSILLLLAGGWLLRAYATDAYAGYSTFEQQTTAMAQSMIAPVLLVGGITGGIAWLLLGALGALSARNRA